MSNYFILDFLLDGLLSLIDIISFAAIGSSIFVIINKNPIVSLFFLILLFGCISIYLMILGLTFMGLAYLIVYIGAVSILFLFILMLINIRISELQSNNANSLILSIIMSITFIYLISPLLPYNIKSFFFNFEFPDRFSYFFTKGNE
jgi:NADH-ubiquinone oxidoreductase chain 6